MTQLRRYVEWDIQIADRPENKMSNNIEREALERDKGRYR